MQVLQRVRSNNNNLTGSGALAVQQAPLPIIIPPVNSNPDIIENGTHFNTRLNTLDFGVKSLSADRIELCLYREPHGVPECARIPLIPQTKFGQKTGKWTHSIKINTLNDLVQKKLDNNDPLYYGLRAFSADTLKYKSDPSKTEENLHKWTPNTKDFELKSMDPKTGKRQNPWKVLIDPYAWEMSHDPLTKGINSDMRIYTNGIYPDDTDGYIDNAKLAPKSIYKIEFDKKSNSNRKTDYKKDINDHIIYETQIMGLTAGLDKPTLLRLYEDDPQMQRKISRDWKDEYRGTYKGASFMARYLKNLGITMVEFMPIMEFQNADPPVAYKDLKYVNNEIDYENMVKNNPDHQSWGYGSNSFFAPDRQLANDQSPGGPTKEVKEMIKVFHDEGIEVCLDVVYNHTGEGGCWKDTENSPETGKYNIFSYRGLDNPDYYSLKTNKAQYTNDSGGGNDINPTSPIVKELTTKSLRHWVNDLDVDAFRFDLAPMLAKTKSNTVDTQDKDSLIKQIEDDNKLKHTKLIAEPWACDYKYQRQGTFSKRWLEWNDKFRDTIRTTINKLRVGQDIDPQRPSLSQVQDVLSGMPARYKGPEPRAINFIACHDGMTLFDIFAFNHKFNRDNDDGENNNNSWDQYRYPLNYGWNTSEKQAKLAREDREKNILTAITLNLFALGTPMFLGGDERFKTKGGNNNTYKNDYRNMINWKSIVNNPDSSNVPKQIRYSFYNAANLTEFFKKMTKFRKANKILHPQIYTWDIYNKNDKNGFPITFDKGNYGDQADLIGMRLNNQAIDNNNLIPTIYLAYNRGIYDIPINMPDHYLPGKKWYEKVNTSNLVTNLNKPNEEYSKLENPPFYDDGKEKLLKDQKKDIIRARSLKIFIER